uniref:CSON001318 protein n=1 Tax=Culicoides sonorensis TaxID=179676 RepID=A0A336LLK7_CULSO
MSRFISIFLVKLIVFLSLANSYKILCLYPTSSRSHLLFAQPLLMALAEKGHQVTVVSPFPLGKSLENYNDVVIPIDFEKRTAMAASIAKGESSGNPLAILRRLAKSVLDGTNVTLNHPDFQKIMKDKTFDAFISGFVVNDFQLGLAAHFGCPSIVLFSLQLTDMLNDVVGQPLHPESVPCMLSNYKGKMNFFQRVANLLIVAGEKLIGMYLTYLNRIYYESNFPSEKYPSYDEVRKNVSLLLVNEHFSQGVVRPNLPNVIEVSGLQIPSKTSPLPDDINDFVEGAVDGLIFVSFGTNIKSKDLPKEKRDILLKSFSGLKQRILWKFEHDSIENLPSNVLTKKWLPQNDILAHKNTKLFISHMGLGSYVEALYHAVPIIAIPFLGDQITNAAKILNEGWIEIILPSELTESNLKSTLDKMLGTEKYANSVKILSDLFKDKPMSPIDTAIYWIEYVIRHRGATHKKYPGVELNFIQSNSLDVFGFLFVVAYICIKLIQKSITSTIKRIIN